MIKISPLQSTFTNAPLNGLLRCQRFIAEWLMVVTTWSSHIRPPFPGGPPFPPIQQDLLQVIQESCIEVTSFVQQVATYQFHLDVLPEHDRQSDMALIEQEAWRRLQAIGFACGLIRSLEVADSCFSFGPHFDGGPNAASRNAYFGSLDQNAHATDFWAAVQTLAAVIDVPQEPDSGEKGKPSAIDRAESNRFYDKTLPTARVALQTAWEGCLKTLSGAAGRIARGELPDKIPDNLRTQMEEFFTYGDKALKAAEALLGTIPGFAASLRQIGEGELANLLENIQPQ